MQSHTAHEELFRRLHEIEQKVQYIERREEEGWRLAKQQIGQITDSSRSSTTVVGNLELKLSKDIQFIEESVSKDIQMEVQRRAEGEQRMRQMIQEEAALVKTTIAQQEKARTNDIDTKLSEMTSTVAQLCTTMEERLAKLTLELVNNSEDSRKEVARVEDKLAQQKAAREAAEMNLLQILEETCVQLHQQIVAERNERVESHKRLERLLLEVSRRQWVRT